MLYSSNSFPPTTTINWICEWTCALSLIIIICIMIIYISLAINQGEIVAPVLTANALCNKSRVVDRHRQCVWPTFCKALWIWVSNLRSQSITRLKAAAHTLASFPIRRRCNSFMMPIGVVAFARSRSDRGIDGGRQIEESHTEHASWFLCCCFLLCSVFVPFVEVVATCE